MRLRATALLLVLFAAAAACSRPGTVFSEQNARVHVERLAGTIGSRPSGSEANARARDYIVDQLQLYGYDVRVQQTDARRPELGRTARVSNIIGVLPGARREAIGLLSHYDSRADTPGAGDDAFGVAVSLEAARVLAAMPDRQWTTYVVVTDAEEQGLMGAAGVMTDPQVRDTLSAYINVEATGAAGPSMLFETGPGNEWLVDAWARHAPRPRGGSFALEVYRRLPNDTDFSILRRHDIPGLNFALVGDSHVYHTDRDVPARLDVQALRDTGDNVVAIVSALQQTDITARSDREATYFDVAGVAAVSYGPGLALAISVVAVVTGLLAWLRITRFVMSREGVGAWLLGIIWAIVGAGVALGAMIAGTMLLRASRGVYHPWYAHPDRFFLFLASLGGVTAWVMARAGRWIPVRSRGMRHPASVWTSALPLWAALAGFTAWTAPAASYLWTLPLLTAGIVLLLVPLRHAAAARAGSVVVLGVAATLWLRDSLELLRFMVAVLGRMPFVTPAYAYAALLGLAGVMIVPPLVAVTVSERRLRRPGLLTAILLAAVAATGIAAWLAPAYTDAHPLRATVRVVQEQGARESTWQLGALEPGVALGADAPGGWRPVNAGDTFPWGRISQPFVFTTTAPPIGPPPAAIGAFDVTPLPDGGTAVRVAVLPREPGLTIAFSLPPGLAPERSNLPGAVRQGRWTATYVNPPPEGVAWQAAFAAASPEQLRAVRVAVLASGIPGGAGAQRLPEWLSTERTAWTAHTTWVVDPAVVPPIEPVPPLR